MSEISANKIVELLGGPTAVARLLSIQPPSVSGWLASKQVPLEKRQRLAHLIVEKSGGKYQLWDVCPESWFEVWPDVVGTKGAPPVPCEKAAA